MSLNHKLKNFNGKTGMLGTSLNVQAKKLQNRASGGFPVY